MRVFLCNLLVLFILSSCASTKRKINKKITDTLNSKFFNNQFTGFLAVDAFTKDTLFDYNSDRYFTPASNTKIFTLYTAMQLLPEKMQIKTTPYISKALVTQPFYTPILMIARQSNF